MDAIDEGHSVLVAAPTGSGKTTVAAYAIAKGINEGKKSFYTTPLKALSNQKYFELINQHGSKNVGLLTGDNSINPGASIVVMTTEILRNMIYANSSTLDNLKYVVLDEVHYLQNPYRGAVWEEIIIHSDPNVDLVCLSATVSNAEEFAEWIQTVRGATTAIIEERRPVELNNLYMIGDKHLPEPYLLPTFVDSKPNPQAKELDVNLDNRSRRGRNPMRLYTPNRIQVIETLTKKNMLPAIYFIFSRSGCDEATWRYMDQGAVLTSVQEQEKITKVAQAKTSHLSQGDLEVLGFDKFLRALQVGVAPHHAGMVPAFKEIVEFCFSKFLIKVIFATETLSLGINMPARSVVIEKLTKFNGEQHEFLTPGEYTQLTGRAGRRGIDKVGYAVVLWSSFVSFDQISSLASKRTYALSSSFKPTYNMAANLVKKYSSNQAHHLLNLSFAQFHSNSDIVRQESRLERLSKTMEATLQAAQCEFGDIDEFRELYKKPSYGLEPHGSKQQIQASFEAVKPGDILLIPGLFRDPRVVVVATAKRKKAQLRLLVVGTDAQKTNLKVNDFIDKLVVVDHMKMKFPYDPNAKDTIEEIASQLRSIEVKTQDKFLSPLKQTSHRKSRISQHPIQRCPKWRAHLRAAMKYDRLQDEYKAIKKQIRSTNESLARQFDRVIGILEIYGYLNQWELTKQGEQLSKIYHESDLLISQCLINLALESLEPCSLAAIISVFTYESRSSHSEQPYEFPNKELSNLWNKISVIAKQVQDIEQKNILALTRFPDPGFMSVAFHWAKGEDLSDLLTTEEISAGDFVRNMKQLIDLLKQLAQISSSAQLAKNAQTAVDKLFRGVVAASYAVEASML